FHQIRIQLATAGAPIIGDVTYGSTIFYLPNAICLHAHRLAFPEQDGAIRTVTAPSPNWAME
ncbi:MAG: RluA family pseudouridine synthase, partial [Bacteroidota bacterium]